MKTLFPMVVVLVLMGAGCAPASKPTSSETPSPAQPDTKQQPVTEPKPSAEQPKPGSEQPSSSESTPSGTVTNPAPSTDAPVVLRPADIDASWRVYTNNALKFQFMWPSRGRYAPEWSVEVYAATDAVVKDGCYQYPGETRVPTTATAKDVVFCHTRSSSATDGQFYVLDAYATTIGTRVAVIRFSKHLANSTTLMNNVAFNENEYQTLLNSIIGTFEMK